MSANPKEQLVHKLVFIPKDKKGKNLPLVKSIEDVTPTDELTSDNIRKMENNIFVKLRQKFPEKTRRELREEARRRSKQEVKRRKATDVK
jgi:hypothetical protein